MKRFAFDPSQMTAFVRVAERARSGDPAWLAPAEASVRAQFDRDHPLWKRCQHTVVLAEGARCVAIVNPRLVADDVPYGQIGWFEAVDFDSARRVLDAAMDWLRQHGCKTCIGPMNGSTWHSYRFVSDQKLAPPFLLEPSNPPSYPRWWRAHGFGPTEIAYWSSTQDNQTTAAALADKRAAAEQAGYRIESVDLSDLDRVLRTIFDLSCQVFTDNPLYSDIEWDEFAALYRGVDRILDGRLIHWLKAPNGAIVGFGFGLRDQFARVRTMAGKDSLWAKLRFVVTPPGNRTIFKSMAIARDHQGKGLASVLFHEQAAQGAQLGCAVGIRALMADGNRSFATGRSLHDVMRRYDLYQRSLA